MPEREVTMSHTTDLMPAGAVRHRLQLLRRAETVLFGDAAASGRGSSTPFVGLRRIEEVRAAFAEELERLLRDAEGRGW